MIFGKKCDICGSHHYSKCPYEKIPISDDEKRKREEEHRIKDENEKLERYLIRQEELRIQKGLSEPKYCPLCDVFYIYHQHFKNPKFRKLEIKINNLVDYIEELDKRLTSMAVDMIKDDIDTINSLNRKIVKRMDMLTESEKDEVISYLAETNIDIFKK